VRPQDGCQFSLRILWPTVLGHLETLAKDPLHLNTGMFCLPLCPMLTAISILGGSFFQQHHTSDFKLSSQGYSGSNAKAFSYKKLIEVIKKMKICQFFGSFQCEVEFTVCNASACKCAHTTVFTILMIVLVLMWVATLPSADVTTSVFLHFSFGGFGGFSGLFGVFWSLET
jgi:hypothetical protein